MSSSAIERTKVDFADFATLDTYVQSRFALAKGLIKLRITESYDISVLFKAAKPYLTEYQLLVTTPQPDQESELEIQNGDIRRYEQVTRHGVSRRELVVHHAVSEHKSLEEATQFWDFIRTLYQTKATERLATLETRIGDLLAYVFQDSKRTPISARAVEEVTYLRDVWSVMTAKYAEVRTVHVYNIDTPDNKSS